MARQAACNARCVYVAEDNRKLLNKIAELENELQREKADKRNLLKIHRAKMRFRDKTEMMLLCVATACVLIYASIALVIRGS